MKEFANKSLIQYLISLKRLIINRPELNSNGSYIMDCNLKKQSIMFAFLFELELRILRKEENDMAKLMAFLMSIMYFFGSLGLWANPAVTINVTDKDGAPVADAVVYYIDNSKNYEALTAVPIGTTDENGSVEWENQTYGETQFYINVAGDFEPFDEANVYTCTVKVSRTSNAPITLQLSDFDAK